MQPREKSAAAVAVLPHGSFASLGKAEVGGRAMPMEKKDELRSQGGSAMVGRLRVFRDSDNDSNQNQPAPSVGVRLGDLLPLIALAERGNYLWLQDFLDDEVRITADLYEVLRAFRSYRPAG
jgi:hypothetical protein